MSKNYDIKELAKKWAPILEEGSPIKNDKIKKATIIMLENQHNEMNEATSYMGGQMGASAPSYTGTNAMFQKIAVPMVRRTFPELFAHDTVGVQPMTGPVGIAFALRFTGTSDYGNPVGAGSTAPYIGMDDHEVGYNYIDNSYSGDRDTVNPSGTAAPTTSAEVWGSKLGSDVGTDIGIGRGRGLHIREINMTIEKDEIEAKTRKLRSRWSLEVAQDIKAMHGLDIEDEMMDVLAYEITAEIDREIVQAITDVAISSSYSWMTDTHYDGRWEHERYRSLYHQMIRKANTIAVNTRRGPGNFVIASPILCAAFEALSAFTVAPVNSNVNTAMTGVARVGSLDGRMTVYRDTFYTSSTQQYIVGYKGPSEFDAGIIYMPYIQLLPARATFEDSFNPTVGLMSRYAIHNHLFGAANYYQKVLITGMPS
jgi:hypothetical protein